MNTAAVTESAPAVSGFVPPLPVDGAATIQRLQLRPKYGNGPRQIELRCHCAGPADAPLVIVQGGISAHANASAWWPALVGPGHAVDTRRWRVLGIDWLDAAAIDAPAVSSEDQADALAALLDAFGVTRARAFIGASYGAMVGLAFAARHGNRLDRLVALAGAHRTHVEASAQRTVQRGIIRMALEHGCAEQGLALARQLALLGYRGSAELTRRFEGGAEFGDGRFKLPVEDWLAHSGNRFAAHFDPRRYLALSESIDLHDIDPAHLHSATTLIGFTSDRLVPLADLCELQRRLGGCATLEVIASAFGHDGFLKEPVRLAPLLRDALDGDAGSHIHSLRTRQ